ncbi:uncharacterized protein LOC135344578 [Halichondria panicea]|uniref:uncharacterized protein LOC135344578 n=1 Tax=Halichondria panicea TaxID=6063 RepID=UPI00312BB1F4
MFFLAPFDLRQSGEVYRIGTVSDEASIQVNCLCEPVSASSNGRRVLLSGFGRSMTAVINRGQYVECRTPHNSRTFCSVQSTRPITVMSYTLGSSVDNLNFTNLIISPSMVYIPPVDSYLTRYSLTSLSDPSSVSLSYTLRESDYEPNTQGLLVNGDAYTPTDGFTTIDCSVDCIASMVCGRGATGVFGVDEFDIHFSSDVPFWGYAYGFAKEISFAYPLPFAMKPIGLAWIEAQDMNVLETVGQVDMEFLITRGDRSTVTRAFAVTRNLSATEGEDCTLTGVRPGSGNSNMRWRRRNSAPVNRFIVPIIDDDIPEPIEKLEIFVECDASENCYLPRQSYTITIIDDQGQCDHLPPLSNGNISYSFNGYPLRPYGTVATHTCNQGYTLSGDENRTCNNSEWLGTMPTCKAFCRDLPPIDNGVLEYDMMESLFNATRPNGTVAMYTCDDGLRLDGNATSYRICDTGNWTATEPVCIENPTVSTARSISQGGDPVIISVTAVMVVAALAILAIVCCLCTKRSVRNKVEKLRVSTIRMRKLSGPGTLIEYQTREILKYVPESMRIPSSNLKLQDAVGQGAFGIVYKGLLMDWNNVAMRGVALKTLKGLFTQNDVQSMVSEITKMQEFHHPHVMPLIGVCLDAEPGVSMVMPYMTNRSLLDYLKKESTYSPLPLPTLEEVYRVLQIRRIRTTPYHPQTDSLVKRFNGTLKSMLKKFTNRNATDWDEYLPYLLFAYREAPQESTGFSPFEMLYGHRVRGPLDILCEGWTDEKAEEVPAITHVVTMRNSQ